MKHKWHKEIKAWADGESIEFKSPKYHDWTATFGPIGWHTDIGYQYRVKPEAYVLYGAVVARGGAYATPMYSELDQLKADWLADNLVEYTFDKEGGSLVALRIITLKEVK